MAVAVPLRVVERVLSKVEREGDCIVSTYSTGSHGYAQVGWVDDRRHMMLCHRVAWEAANGAILDGLTVDHVCRNRRCINIEHLRLLTNVENARLNGNAIKTHCVYGHEFTAENTRVNRFGHRYCRTCMFITNSARYVGTTDQS